MSIGNFYFQQENSSLWTNQLSCMILFLTKKTPKDSLYTITLLHSISMELNVQEKFFRVDWKKHLQWRFSTSRLKTILICAIDGYPSHSRWCWSNNIKWENKRFPPPFSDITFYLCNRKKHFLFCQFAQNLGQGCSFPFISSLD